MTEETGLADLTRRDALQIGTAMAAGAVVPSAAANRFDVGVVRAMARDLAQRPYRAPASPSLAGAGAMTYDQYRSIRFRRDRALWRDQGLPFQVSMFPCGFLYRRPIPIYEVWRGSCTPVVFGADLFETDDPSVQLSGVAGFAGLKVQAPINQPDVFEEFCVFLGASYFRAVGRNLQYGLSARGLALGTGAATPEEFPDFTAFWLERPRPDAALLVIHALLDSPSASGAFSFTLQPGETTTVDVQSALFPRIDIADAGIAPLTSMYYFADADHAARPRARPDDWRSGVHDSNGLSIMTGQGEFLWRSLANPVSVQFSAFVDDSPRGFGLRQRRRRFEDYGDLQVMYERRPSLWIEPIGDWGPGAVALVEIPSDSEYNDNIVAFWRGRDPLLSGGEYDFSYRMRWGADQAGDAGPARIVAVRAGAGDLPGTRVFVLDLAGPALRSTEDAKARVELSASAGQAGVGYSGPGPGQGQWRISIDFDPAGARLADLRCRLVDDRGALSETWLHRWTA